MATEKQIAANRMNSQFSSGPRTEAGKARSSRNALRDGFYSKALIIMPGMEAEFQLLRDQLLESFKPDGGVEDAIFDELLIASWNLRRAAVAEADIYSRQTDETLDPLNDDQHDSKFRRIRQFARLNQIARDKAAKMLSDIQTEVRARLQAFPPDETLDTPVKQQMPHSVSLLCRLSDVVRAIKISKGVKSAPPIGKTSAGNEANQSAKSPLQTVEALLAHAAATAESAQQEPAN